MKRETKLKQADQTLERMILEGGLAPAPVPQLNRSAAGQWTLTYAGPADGFLNVAGRAKQDKLCS